MVLVALANVLLHDVMVRRFHARSAGQGHRAAAPGAGARASRRRPSRASPRRCGCRGPSRRCRSGATARRTPRCRTAQFLSNGAYVTVVTNAGGGSSSWRGRAVTRCAPRRHHRSDRPGDLPARRGQRHGLVGGVPAGGGRTRRIPGHLHLRQGDLAPPRRRHHHPARRRRVARGRRRGAADHPAPSRPRRPRDRRHQLRRDGAGAAERRPRPPGVRQALRRDRVLGEQHRAALPSAAARRRPTRCGRCMC